MKTEFMEYLDNLKHYDQQNHSHLLETSRNAVAEALSGDFEKLNRLFFDFPFYYEIQVDAESKILCVVPQSKRERWMQKYDNLIAQSNFAVTYDNGLPHITANPETATEIAKFNADILITACADLLDLQGNLKPELIDFFNFSPLLARYQEDPSAIQSIIHHIIYSYWLEIVNVNLGLIAIQNDCNVIQLECLNGYAKALLYGNREFTAFFAANMADYKTKFAETHFTAYLRDLPVYRISGSVHIETLAVSDGEDI